MYLANHGPTGGTRRLKPTVIKTTMPNQIATLSGGMPKSSPMTAG